MSQCRASLLDNEKATFHDAVRLCSIWKDVASINHACLRDFAVPVTEVLAKHNKPEWASIKSNEAGNLSNSLPLCVGARIMLLDNIWTERGLVNGSSGTIVNFLWPLGSTDRKSQPPKAILVGLTGYTGPGLYTQEDGKVVIPLFPISRDFYWNRTACSRVQFPICLA